MIDFKSEVVYLDYRKNPYDTCSKYEQLSFLTNENDPYFQMDVIYKSKLTLAEYIANNDYRGLIIYVARRMNFNMSSIGTTYFIETLLYLFQNDLPARQSNEAFKIISEKYNTTITRVRANITNSLNTMNRFVDERRFNFYFPEYDGRNPSLIYSITLALERLDEVFNKNTLRYH